MKTENGRKLLQLLDFKYVCKGTFLALVISLIVCTLVAAVLYLTPLSEKVVPYAIYITSIFSIIIGAAYAARRMQFKGWLYGGLTGLAYIAVLLVLLKVFGIDADVSLQLFSKLFLGFVLGAMGGILGLNL